MCNESRVSLGCPHKADTKRRMCAKSNMRKEDWIKIIQQGFFLKNQKTMLHKAGQSQQQFLAGVQPILIRGNSRQGLTMDCYSSKGGEMGQ